MTRKKSLRERRCPWARVRVGAANQRIVGVTVTPLEAFCCTAFKPLWGNLVVPETAFELRRPKPS